MIDLDWAGIIHRGHMKREITCTKEGSINKYKAGNKGML